MKSKQKKIEKELKQVQFVNHWSHRDTFQTYDALKDKHAAYYFENNGVKKRLKKLRKALQFQTMGQPKKEYGQLLMNKILSIKGDQSEYKKVQIYQKSLQSTSMKKLEKFKLNFRDRTEMNKSRQSEERSKIKSQGIKQTLKTIDKTQQLTNQNQPKNTLNNDEGHRLKYTSQKSYSYKIRDVKANQTPSLYKKKKNSATLQKMVYENINKSELNKKRVKQIIQLQKKQVKHHEFMQFLKKKHQDILKYKNLNEK